MRNLEKVSYFYIHTYISFLVQESYLSNTYIHTYIHTYITWKVNFFSLDAADRKNDVSKANKVKAFISSAGKEDLLELLQVSYIHTYFYIHTYIHSISLRKAPTSSMAWSKYA